MVALPNLSGRWRGARIRLILLCATRPEGKIGPTVPDLNPVERLMESKLSAKDSVER